LGVSPEINALSTIMIGIVTVGVLTASLINKRKVVQRLKDEKAAN
jgi:putrescine transport system permease protein